MSLSMFAKKSIEVGFTDNGWVLEWTDETRDEKRTSFDQNRARTRGLEVYTNRDKLIARIKDFL